MSTHTAMTTESRDQREGQPEPKSAGIPGGGAVLGATPCSAFRFIVGATYETQAGELVTIIGRTDLKGYECIECSDGLYRYDRSTHDKDAGRVTGSAHDYSCPQNFKRQNDQGHGAHPVDIKTTD